MLGNGELSYEVSGEDWGRLPDGWSYREATFEAVDSRDNIYVFNRGEHPVIVLDSKGGFLRSWGEGIFTTPHGVAMVPDDTLLCIDRGDHTIRKFSLDGRLPMTAADTVRQRATLSILAKRHNEMKPDISCNLLYPPFWRGSSGPSERSFASE